MAFYLRRLWLTKYSRFSRLLVVLVLIYGYTSMYISGSIGSNQIRVTYSFRFI